MNVFVLAVPGTVVSTTPTLTASAPSPICQRDYKTHKNITPPFL